MLALLEVLMFLAVALLAFYVGRETGRVERRHGHFLGRTLHPSAERASVIDQPSGESVRLLRDADDTAAPYDWDSGADELGDSPHGTDTGRTD